jgi:UDP-3-O-[3-hydroxymyristoyl] glucosamine N-acyltransferase
MMQNFSFSCREVQARFPQWIGEIVGDADTRVASVGAPATRDPNALAFCATPLALREGFASKAAALVVPPGAGAGAGAYAGALLICKKPDVFMSIFLNELVLRTPYRDATLEGAHPAAIIHPEARVAASATIGPGAVVARGAIVGERAYIGANAVIEASAEIGADSVVHPLVYVGHSTKIGERCEIYPNCTIGKEGFGYATDERGAHHKIPHLGKVVVEDGVHIGGGCVIDRATFEETRICAGSKLDNLVHIAHNCKIGAGSIVTAFFAMAGSSEVGRNVTGHIKVGDHVRVAALSAISKDLDQPGEYGGVPLVPLQRHLRIKAAMAHLPEMRKQLDRLARHVFGESEKP